MYRKKRINGTVFNYIILADWPTINGAVKQILRGVAGRCKRGGRPEFKLKGAKDAKLNSLDSDLEMI